MRNQRPSPSDHSQPSPIVTPCSTDELHHQNPWKIYKITLDYHTKPIPNTKPTLSISTSTNKSQVSRTCNQKQISKPRRYLSFERKSTIYRYGHLFGTYIVDLVTVQKPTSSHPVRQFQTILDNKETHSLLQ